MQYYWLASVILMEDNKLTAYETGLNLGLKRLCDYMAHLIHFAASHS